MKTMNVNNHKIQNALQMEKLSSSASSSSPNHLLGLRNDVTTSTNSHGSNNSNNNRPSNQTNHISKKTQPPSHSYQELALAERSIRNLVQDSHFFPPEAAEEDWFHHNMKHSSDTAHTKVATLYEHELHVGRMLGHGGFCHVRIADIKNEEQEHYAVKYLHPSNKNKSSFSRGAADLAIEARFLSLLSHENIIKLHYVSDGTLAEVYNCQDGEQGRGRTKRMSPDLREYGYFLVLDYLRDTLLQRIQHHYIPSMMSHGFSHPKVHHNKHTRCSYGEKGWSNSAKRSDESQLHWWNKRSWQKNKNEEYNHKMQFLQQSMRTRLGILRQIACALEYLHANGIIYRDVKPDNIGFYFNPDDLCSDEESDGIPKLFDFGLVKELKPSLRKSLSVFGASLDNVTDDENALFKLTGRTGSRRYMAPEVAFYKPYNLKADVYSFGILLYETITLVQPFDGYSLERHEAFVLKGGERPCLIGYTKSGSCWPIELKHLIEDCWAADLKHRPTMSDAVKRLDKCLEELNERRSYYDNSEISVGKKKGLISSMFPSAA